MLQATEVGGATLLKTNPDFALSLYPSSVRPAAMRFERSP
jgi:hypothetical protein